MVQCFYIFCYTCILNRHLMRTICQSRLQAKENEIWLLTHFEGGGGFLE